jgi:DNA-directed RNA polymerase
MIKNEWKGLDKPKEDEDYKEYQKRVKQFEKYDRTAKDVMTHLEIADNEFYLTHKYDKRGRIYCQGYHVNYQGTPWNKAVIQFANEEIVE